MRQFDWQQEDKNGSSISYHFKPDFALDTLRAVNSICHFSVIRRGLLEQVGMFRSEFDGSQDHDLFLRLAGFAERIEHIPKVLYLWRSHTASVSKNSNTSSYVADAAKRAVLEHLRQQGIVATIQSSPLQTTAFKINYEIIGNPMVLIAICYNGMVKETTRCIDAIVKRSLYENYELAVWNVSCHTQEEQEYFGRLKECKSIQVVNDYEEISLKGAKHIVWLDSGVEVANREWIQELLMYSQRDDVGAVGGKILDSEWLYCWCRQRWRCHGIP